MCPSVCVSVCAQNTRVCKSAGGGIKLHLVTALVWFASVTTGYKLCSVTCLYWIDIRMTYGETNDYIVRLRWWTHVINIDNLKLFEL